MTIKNWLARHTSNPSKYAESYCAGLNELVEYLAASFVAFSGRQDAAHAGTTFDFIYKNHFEMESAGYQPVTKDVVSLTNPRMSEMANEALFSSAYQVTWAFLCLCVDNAARRSFLQAQHVEQFCQSLHISAARKIAGKFGFSSNPEISHARLRELASRLVCEKILNKEDFGKNDGLGATLRLLRISSDHEIRYGFVAGAPGQSLGCATHFVTVIAEVDTKLAQYARDVGW